MPEPSLPHLVLAVLTVDFLRYAITAGPVWLLIEVALGRRLAGRRLFTGMRPAGADAARDRLFASTVRDLCRQRAADWLLSRRRHDRSSTRRARARLDLVGVSLVADHRRARRLVLLDASAAAHAAPSSGRCTAAPCIAHPTPWAAYAFHPVEALIQAAFLPLYLRLVPTHGGGHRGVPGAHDPAQHRGPLRPRGNALALDSPRLAGLDHAGESPSLPPRPQPRQLRPVLHVVGPLVRHRRRRNTCATATLVLPPRPDAEAAR